MSHRAVLLAALKPRVAWSDPEEKVVICHRTNSPTNPYNQIAVAGRDLSAYEDQTVTVALVANGQVLGQRTLRIDCEQPPGPGPDTDTAPGSDTAPGDAGSTPVPTVIPSGAPPEPTRPRWVRRARRRGHPRPQRGCAAGSPGSLTGSSSPASCATRDAISRSRTPSLR